MHLLTCARNLQLRHIYINLLLVSLRVILCLYRIDPDFNSNGHENALISRVGIRVRILILFVVLLKMVHI